MIVEIDKSPNKIINKNLLHFNVKGALDFSENLYIEMYSDQEIGSEEVPINDFVKKLGGAFPNLYEVFNTQCRYLKLDHHFNVRQRSIWVICKHHFRHSHEGWGSNGKTTKLNNFDKAIEYLTGEHSGYSLEILGHRLDSQVEDLEKYYQGDVERYASFGIPMQKLGEVYGVCKIYETYVGNAKGLIQSTREDAEKIREIGKEYGETTGRPRDIGYLDLQKLIDAINHTGVKILFINKVDILKETNIFKIVDIDKQIKEFDNFEDMKDSIVDNLVTWTEIYSDNIIFSESKDGTDIKI